MNKNAIISALDQIELDADALTVGEELATDLAGYASVIRRELETVAVSDGEIASARALQSRLDAANARIRSLVEAIEKADAKTAAAAEVEWRRCIALAEEETCPFQACDCGVDHPAHSVERIRTSPPAAPVTLHVCLPHAENPLVCAVCGLAYGKPFEAPRYFGGDERFTRASTRAAAATVPEDNNIDPPMQKHWQRRKDRSKSPKEQPEDLPQV